MHERQLLTPCTRHHGVGQNDFRCLQGAHRLFMM